MSPFNEYRKIYISVCFITAVIYAFVMGTGQPVIVYLTDGLIFGILLFVAGIILWNTFRFAIPVSYSPKYRNIFMVIFIIITGLLISGIETFAIYLCFPSSFNTYVLTLPVRIFLTWLLLFILYLLYLYYYEIAKHVKIQPATAIDRITVRNGQKIKIIPVDSIIYIKADGDYITIHTSEGKWLKEQTMKYTEDQLPANCFLRIHRSYIVNIHQISRIERYGEKQLIVLQNNEKIKISAARYQLLKQILGI